jgi:hypothetical protein
MTRPDSPLPEQTDAPSRNDAPGPAQLERLPYGHPSSPYNSDGSRKPPVPDLRSLELPLPSEDSGSRESGDAQSWQESLAELRDDWQGHLERWPADESAAEPEDHYLSPDEKNVAKESFDRARSFEKDVSSAMRTVEADTPGCELVGFKFHLKTEDRYMEKVATLRADNTVDSFEDIVNNIPDTLRYTCQFDRSIYAVGVERSISNIEDCGFAMEEGRNTWTSDHYKGINTRWRVPDGPLFEVQFHTPESFEAKQFTHAAYERIRSLSVSDEENSELDAFQAKVCSKIPEPEGAREILAP